MSVCLMISNPVNREEDNFCIPIAAEQVYQEYWLPIAESNNLRWAKWFQCGVEFEKKDMKLILQELTEFRRKIPTNIDAVRRNQLYERVDNLYKGLTEILECARDDIKIYIG